MGSEDHVPLFARYGFTRTADSAAPLVVEPYDAVCVHGALRATVVASAIDLVGGFVTRALAGSEATFTTDLSLRIPAPSAPDRLVAHAEVLRPGRRLVTTAVRLATGAVDFAQGVVTFMRVPRDPGTAAPTDLATPAEIPFHPLARPLDAEVGIEPVSGTPGTVRLPLAPRLLNPEGVLQGALVALLCESAALARAQASGLAHRVVTELDLRYLAAASLGPVTATADWIGEPDQGALALTLRDEGRDRRVATAFARLARAPGRGTVTA
ncbi:MAG: hypothetical protein AAF430_01020 [Myxococcota bacterium]